MRYATMSESRPSFIRAIYSGTQALRAVVKDTARARTIATVVAKHGFSELLERRQRDSATDAQVREAVLAGDGKDALAERAVKMLEELGPTFVKFGQVLSTRPDLVPARFATQLQALQDHVSAVSFEDVKRTVEFGLGKSLSALFASVDEVPIASASIAQVHGARTHDGADVVIKVQRPGLLPIIEADLSLMRFLVDQVVGVFPELQTFYIDGMLQEFEQSLRRELDFDSERRNLERFTRNFQAKPRIHIPRAFASLSCSTVLTMERISGRKLTHITDEDERKNVAQAYLDASYQMLFHDGFFHGDLHPGNVFLEDDGRLGLIDFGMVGRLSRQHRERLVDVLWALMSEDLENVARIWFQVGKPGGVVNYAAFEGETVDVLERHIVGRELHEWDLASFFRDLAAGAIKHGVRLPTDFTMMFKAMVTTEGLARQVAAGINPVEAARPYIEQLVRDRYSLDRMRQKALVEGVRIVDQLWTVPATIERLTDKFEAGDVRVRLHHDGMDERLRAVSGALNRASLSILAAAGAITGALTMGKGTDVMWGLSWVSLAGFTIAFASTLFFGWSWVRGRG
jgi:ubiquinone biosynthesis protein